LAVDVELAEILPLPLPLRDPETGDVTLALADGCPMAVPVTLPVMLPLTSVGGTREALARTQRASWRAKKSERSMLVGGVVVVAVNIRLKGGD
jgi:hypothetical protein